MPVVSFTAEQTKEAFDVARNSIELLTMVLSSSPKQDALQRKGVVHDTDPSSLVTGSQGGMVNDEGDPLVLPIGPITRSRAKRYGAAISLFVQAQITQELHDVAFNKCCEELEGIPRLLMLLVAY
ncbi:hypothetical protein JCGZ_20131 [Jatropha curcas]|uniref:Uncharacterized protein n=1 Tax=Jatropha curcas TaxID=180498 RepID=A0A067JUA4_JATCU|nr:hypothetical protein JCGZ_20131 [Jatropha curcas]